MNVQDVMTREVHTCAPTTNLAAVAELMWRNDCGALPIVDGGKLKGIVTDRDICIALGTRNARASDVTAAGVAAPIVTTCAASDDLHHALRIMRAHKIRRLPVVDEEGNLQGILCLNEIVLRAHKGDRRAADICYEDVVSTLKAICEHRHHDTGDLKPIAVAMAAANKQQETLQAAVNLSRCCASAQSLSNRR